MGSEFLSGRVEAELELRTLAMPFRRLRQRVSCSQVGAMLMKPRVMLMELKIQSVFSRLTSSSIEQKLAGKSLGQLCTDQGKLMSVPGRALQEAILPRSNKDTSWLILEVDTIISNSILEVDTIYLIVYYQILTIMYSLAFVNQSGKINVMPTNLI